MLANCLRRWSCQRARDKGRLAEGEKGEERTLSNDSADLLPHVLSSVLERARSGLVGDFGGSVSDLEMRGRLAGRGSRWEARDGESSDRGELMTGER